MSEAIDVVRALTLVLNTDRDAALDKYELQVRTVMEAAQRWATEMDRLQDALQQRPDLSPARTPSRQMPTPDGWLGYISDPEAPTAYWRIGKLDAFLVYTKGIGWGVYHQGLVNELESLMELGPKVVEVTAPKQKV